MKHDVELLLSLPLEDFDPAGLLREVVGPALEAEIESGRVWIDAHSTDDSRYPTLISVLWDQDKLGLGEHAEIELAQRLHEIRSIDSVVSCHDLIAGLDPQDPYWCLLYEDGRWYFGDTCSSLLETEDGTPGVVRRGELDLTRLLQRRYAWNRERGTLDCRARGSTA